MESAVAPIQTRPPGNGLGKRLVVPIALLNTRLMGTDGPVRGLEQEHGFARIHRQGDEAPVVLDKSQAEWATRPARGGYGVGKREPGVVTQ